MAEETLRRKPVPSPIARPEDVGLAPRPLAPSASRRALPTVAALLAATATLACQGRSFDATPEPVAIAHHIERRGEPVEVKPSALDPAAPLPGMGALEHDPVVPVTEPKPRPMPVPTTHPIPVKGAVKHVAPKPIAKPPKLGGDVAAVLPETT